MAKRNARQTKQQTKHEIELPEEYDGHVLVEVTGANNGDGAVWAYLELAEHEELRDSLKLKSGKPGAPMVKFNCCVRCPSCDGDPTANYYGVFNSFTELLQGISVDTGCEFIVRYDDYIMAHMAWYTPTATFIKEMKAGDDTVTTATAERLHEMRKQCMA